ncbi:MAG: hypothetical protein AB7I30_05655 [Isosphaeraceae bacterium]
MPFVLRTGKALGRDRNEIVASDRPVPHLPFERSAPQAMRESWTISPTTLKNVKAATIADR